MLSNRGLAHTVAVDETGWVLSFVDRTERW
jgi:hypothetical protein